MAFSSAWAGSAAGVWLSGIVRREDFLPYDSGVKRESDRRRIALTLLLDLERSYSTSDEPLLNAIYLQVKVGGRVYKTTRRARFGALDMRLVEDVVRRFPTQEPLRVHDVGASSAITSLDLFRAFRKHMRIWLHASDYYDHLGFVTCRDSPWTVVFDAEGRALQIIGGRFVLSVSEGESRRHPVNWLLEHLLRRILLPRASALLAEAPRYSADTVVHESENGTVRFLTFVHPEVARLLRTEERFSFGHHDVFRPTDVLYHVVRAMNLLNPEYFAPPLLVRAVRAIAFGMVEGGLLLVGRTVDEEDGRTRATAFVRERHRFVPVWDNGEGAENRALIEDVDLAQTEETARS